jgi:hypothetical protein
MGIIVNPRGAGGAGKTALVLRLMAAYGAPAPIHRAGRTQPIGYRLPHPAGGRPFAVLGTYGATRGGCDTIPLRDGGLAEALRLTGAWASEGHDVVLEGLVLSREHRRTAELARAHPLHIIRLATSAEDCARALVAHHRGPRDRLPDIASAAAAMDAEIEAACRALQASRALFAVLGFEDALRHAHGLLGLPPPTP